MSEPIKRAVEPNGFAKAFSATLNAPVLQTSLQQYNKGTSRINLHLWFNATKANNSVRVQTDASTAATDEKTYTE